ncbi:MAG: cadmium-translocating P-type ATPase [Aerococcus sp.]|nr:cadmium-translocating P-type ATPase [Aerococcus sp.]
MSNKAKLASIGVIAALSLFFEFGLGKPSWAFILIAIAGGLLAFSMFLEMIQTLKEGRYGVDLLAITAIISTLIVREYWASLMILLMLIGGETLEDYASNRASRELKSLIERAPTRTKRLTNGNWEDIAIQEVRIGDRLLVRPNEIIPVDGTMASGHSFIDEASITGESKPVEKSPGDALLSGAINDDKPMEMTADKLPEDSQYQALVRLVKESTDRPAKFVRMADRYAVPFTLIAYIIGGVAWFISKDPVRFAQVMVVASPCPLILAAPISMIGGMSRCSRHGIIVKSGETLEKMEQAKTIAFDKTGTLTKGILAVDRIQVDASELSEEEFMRLVAGMEQSSMHVIARSITDYTTKQHIQPLTIDDVSEVVGSGLTGHYQGKEIKLGKAAFAGYTSNDSYTTALYVSINDKPAGWVTFEDVVRSESREVIDTLRENGVNKVVMLTGDRQETAGRIGSDLNVDEVYAQLLPQDKIAFLKNLENNQRPVCMVGDGVNDAPALAIADVGVAMGAHGATAASESADAVILRDDLSGLNQLTKISKQTMSIARQSVWIGIIVCLVLMAIAATGVIPTLIGAIFQEMVDLISILWSVRSLSDR